LISNALRLSANQLAIDFCRKKWYKIIEYYQSSPNFYCYVEPIGMTEDQTISSFHYGEALFS
jgi:hypothetical protein